VRHRLRVAGAGDREIFEPETFPVIFKYAGGIPRLINTLCDTALLAAFAQDRTTVCAEDMKAAIAELQWVEYAARTFTSLPGQLDDTASQEQPPVGRLVLSHQGEPVTEALLVPGRFVIGRTPDNDLQVDGKFVSRHHAQVITTPEGSVIEDLNSTNGIFVAGKRVRRYRLRQGDVVSLGMHKLAYFREDPCATQTATLGRDDAGEEENAEAEDENGG
jgi:hypothetical protein